MKCNTWQPSCMAVACLVLCSPAALASDQSPSYPLLLLVTCLSCPVLIRSSCHQANVMSWYHCVTGHVYHEDHVSCYVPGSQTYMMVCSCRLSSSRLKETAAFVGLLMVLYPLLPETPYWLVLNGDLAGADAVLQRMAKINGVHLPQVTPCNTCMCRRHSTDHELTALTWPHGSMWAAIHDRCLHVLVDV